MLLKYPVVFLLLGGIMLAFASTATAAGLVMKGLAEKEYTRVDKDGNTYLEYRPAADVEVVPGDTVRFTNAYVNTSDDAVNEGAAITNPLPAEMAYMGGTATGEDGLDVKFSVDGGRSFGAPDELFVTGEDGKRRLALPEEYTHIKWVLKKKLPPGEGGSVGYKAKVK